MSGFADSVSGRYGFAIRRLLFFTATFFVAVLHVPRSLAQEEQSGGPVACPTDISWIYGRSGWFSNGEMVQFVGDAQTSQVVAPSCSGQSSRWSTCEIDLLSRFGKSDSRADSPCAGEPTILGFDGSIENGVHWRGDGVQEDYVGAFGQGFDLGAGTLRCADFWLTQVGHYNDALSDVYVWSGGTDSEPDQVLFVLQDLVFANVPNWPEVGENRVAIDLPVDGAFTIGCWGQWPGEVPGRYYWGVDTNGPVEPAWTLIGFDQGYPVGWQHPSVVWSDIKSMAMGVVFEVNPVPVRTTTWGRVKALTRF